MTLLGYLRPKVERLKVQMRFENTTWEEVKPNKFG